MRTIISLGTCLAFVVALTVAALAQQASSGMQQSTQGTSAKNVSVTGCIQRAEATAGTSGTSGMTGSTTETKFVLTNATLSSSGTSGSSASSSSTSGTSGMSGSEMPATAVASEYRLEGDSSKLSPHVGHKVEITGNVEQPSSSMNTTEPPAASAANAPKLKVSKVRMISSTCQ